MYNIIIYCIFDPWAEMKPQLTILGETYTQSQAELRGLRWLLYRPDDIIMMVPA